MRGRYRVLGGVCALVLTAACGGGGDTRIGAGPVPTTAASTASTVTTVATTATSAASSSTLVDDAAGIEARLVDQMKRQSPDFAVGAARCPTGPPEGDIGTSATCTVQVEGVDVPFTVTLLADNPEIQGGAHNYSVDPARPLVDVGALVDSIRSQAATQLKVAPDRLRVDCGAAKVQVLDVGSTIPCTVVNGDTTRRLVATVTDANGSVKVSEPAPPKG